MMVSVDSNAHEENVDTHDKHDNLRVEPNEEAWSVEDTKLFLRTLLHCMQMNCTRQQVLLYILCVYIYIF